MESPRYLLLAAVATTCVGLSVSSIHAQSAYTSGHGDLGIEYTAGETEFEPHWHLHDGAVVDGAALPEEEEFEPDGLVAETTALSATPDGSAAWLGVADGTVTYRLGSETYEPELGFGFEELTDTDWADSSITLTLTGWSLSNAGDVALLSGTSPDYTVYASTFDAGSSENANSWEIDLGTGHEHPVWYFSEAGDYSLTFTWSGTYIGAGSDPGGTPVTGIGTFSFRAVPEPAAWSLLGLGMLTALLLRRRRADVLSASTVLSS